MPSGQNPLEGMNFFKLLTLLHRSFFCRK